METKLNQKSNFPEKAELLRAVDFPFDLSILMRKKSSIENALSALGSEPSIRIAVLGGSTTHEIVKILKLLLMKIGILADFYEGAYNQYYEAVKFGDQKLDEFSPSIIYFHIGIENFEYFNQPNESKICPAEAALKKYLKSGKQRNRSMVVKSYSTTWSHLRLDSKAT